MEVIYRFTIVKCKKVDSDIITMTYREFESARADLSESSESSTDFS